MKFELNKCKYSILKAMAFSQFFELNLDGEKSITRHRNLYQLDLCLVNLWHITANVPQWIFKTYIKILTKIIQIP